MRRWEKVIPNGDTFWYKAIIEEENSIIRGSIFSYECYEEHNDGSRGSSLTNGWHDTLQGAKRAVDKEYDIDPNVKTKWKMIKGAEKGGDKD